MFAVDGRFLRKYCTSGRPAPPGSSAGSGSSAGAGPKAPLDVAGRILLALVARVGGSPFDEADWTLAGATGCAQRLEAAAGYAVAGPDGGIPCPDGAAVRAGPDFGRCGRSGWLTSPCCQKS